MKSIKTKLFLPLIILFGFFQITLAQKTLNVRINSADDDQEEWIPAGVGQTQSKTIGGLDAGSSDLEFGTEASGNDPQIVGLRFNNITIPKGAIITNAYIQFTVDAIGKNNDPCNIIIKGEDTDSAVIFNPAINFNISTRTRTLDSVLWNVTGTSWGTVGAASAEQQTPSIHKIIEAIISRDGWKSGNSLALYLYGTGTREVESFDGDAPKAPMLVITYIEPVTLSIRINAADDDQEEWIPAGAGQTQSKTIGSLDAGSSDLEFGTESTGNDPQIVGMRFNNIALPKGAIVKNAYIQFTVDAIGKNNDPCNVIIKGEDTDSALIFNPAINFNISSRPKTLDSVLWAVSGSSWGTVGAATEEQRTTNINSIIQSIVNRNGWKSGNSLALYMYGTGTREVESFDGDAPKAPLLVIEYIPIKTLSVRVGAAEDDQEEWTAAGPGQTQSKTVGSLDAGSSDLELGTEAAGNDPQTVGIRFNNINLPKGTIIQNAYIQFTVDAISKNADPCVITIKGEDTDSAVIFDPSQSFNITSRQLTIDSVIWNVSGSTWSTVGAATADQRTVNLKPILQNLLNRNGWKSGNSVAFFLKGTGTREVESFDGDAPKAPLLVIDYLGGDGGGPTTKPRIAVSYYPVSKKSDWLYSDIGADLGKEWSEFAYQKDTTWDIGKGPLGFGELGFTGKDINAGPINNRNITTYFRKPIIVSNLAAVSDTIELQLMADDGAVVYINGNEVTRRYLPTGTVSFSTKANTIAEQPYERLYWLYYLPKSVLKADTNIIAVEIHQSDSLSSDLLFDLALNNRKFTANPPALGCGTGSSNHISCFTSVLPTEQFDTLTLPNSHAFQVIANTGTAYSKTGLVPSNFDFTAFIPINGSSKKGYLSLNHERSIGGVSIFDLQYNCTTGFWVVDSINPVDFTGELVLTSSNCSGGISPWNTVITCEETTTSLDANSDGYHDLGWNIEIDPKTRRVKEYGNGKREKLWAMGKMSHENIVFLQDSITSYFGEDEPDGSIYKFVADQTAALTGATDRSSPSLRVIADHIRACAFLISDGVVPSNEGRGYVLRRIARRAMRHGHKLGQNGLFFYKLVPVLSRVMGEAYPELRERGAQIERVLRAEEERFAETLGAGLQQFETRMQKAGGKVVPGSLAFLLHDTYGFPPDLTNDIARERGLTVDMAGYEAEMNTQRERARAASRFNVDLRGGAVIDANSEFTGYSDRSNDARVVALLRGGEPVQALAASESGEVVLERTPFYAEAGGQVGDTGTLSSAGSSDVRFSVLDTQKRGKAHVHIGCVEAGTIRLGDMLLARIDDERRAAIRLNHSATHLLHAALRKVLGTHVTQKGSLVAPDRLRFDFGHFQPVTSEELVAIEALVNEQIRANAPAETRVMGYEQAVASGAMALFGEKYDDEVRVLSIGDFSTELCGGTHVNRAGDIGLLRIVSESGVAAGVRRIEAVTGAAALAHIARSEQRLREVAALVRGTPDEVTDKVREQLERVRALEKEVRALQEKLASGKGDDLAASATSVGAAKIVVAQIDGGDANALRATADQLKSKLGSAVIVLATVQAEGRVPIVATVTKNLTARVNAGELVSTLAAELGGKGGGKPDFAQGAGNSSAKLSTALAELHTTIKNRLAQA